MKSIQVRISEFRNALKLARRSVGRNLLQSLLIVLIMAIPVGAVAFAQTYSSSKEASAEEGLTTWLGQTQAAFFVNDLPADCLYQDPLQPLTVDGVWLVMAFESEEEYARCIESQSGEEFVNPTELGLAGKWLVESRAAGYVTSDERLVNVEVVIGEAWNPVFQGRYQNLVGEAPKAANEVLVTPSTLENLNLQLGDTLQLSEQGYQVKVVGTLESSQDSDAANVIFAVEDFASFAPQVAEAAFMPIHFLFSDTTVTWSQVTEFNSLGIAVISRDVVLNPPPKEAIPYYQQPGFGNANTSRQQDQLLGSFWAFVALMFPVGTLSASAFAFGVRRQSRNLAIVASLGASSRMLKLVNITSGLWLGLLGATVGVAFGVSLAAWRLAADFDGSTWSYPGFHLPWLSLAMVALLGIIAGVLFSLFPAIRAAKVDIQSQLRDTRAQGNPRVRGGIVSLLLLLVGTALMTASVLWMQNLAQNPTSTTQWTYYAPLVALGGGVVFAIGLMTGSVWVLKLLQLIGKHSPGPMSYAVRDLIFNHKRFVPVISSILAVIFVGTMFSAVNYHFMKVSEASNRPMMPSNQVMVDVTLTIPSLAMNWGELSPEDLSERISHASAALAAKVDALKELGAEGAGVLSGQPRPIFSGIDGSAAEGSREFARIKQNPAGICPWDMRNPDYERYQQAGEKQDYDTLSELDTKYAGCGQLDPNFSLLLVGGEEELKIASAGTAPQAAFDALAQGKVVVFDPGWLAGDKLTLELIDPTLPSNQEPIRTFTTEAFVEPVVGNRLAAFMSPATADKLGVFYEPVAIGAYFDSTLQETKLEELRFVLGSNMEYDYSATIWTADNIAWAFMLAVGGLSLAIALIAIGLAQIESRADRGALWSVGASRWYRSRVVGLQGVLLSGVGILLGGGSGLVTGIALISLFQTPEQELDFMVPWTQLATVAIVIPATVAAASAIFGAGKLTRKRSALD